MTSSTQAGDRLYSRQFRPLPAGCTSVFETNDGEFERTNMIESDTRGKREILFSPSSGSFRVILIRREEFPTGIFRAS
jgi:hypothetical protein